MGLPLCMSLHKNLKPGIYTVRREVAWFDSELCHGEEGVGEEGGSQHNIRSTIVVWAQGCFKIIRFVFPCLNSNILQARFRFLI